MPKLEIKVSERKDWSDDEALLALQCNGKPPPRPLHPLGDARGDAEHLDPLVDVPGDDGA